MKKIVSTLLVCLLLVGSMLALVSCGGIDNGTYVATVAGQEMTLKVEGDKMIMEQEIGGGIEGTIKIVQKYEIKDDEITVTLESFELVGGGKDAQDAFNTYVKPTMQDQIGESETSSFEKTDNGFKMDGVEFVKQ